jgi:hypothetical protein
MTFFGALDLGNRRGKHNTQAMIGINRDPCLAFVCYIEMRPLRPRKA